MKNVIEYYYNLNAKDIRHKDKKYTFFDNNDKYVFTCCNEVIDEIYDIYELNIYLNYIGIYNHQIIINKDKNIITSVNNNSYILMKILDGLDKKINFDDLIKYNNVHIDYFKKLRRNDWKKLWIEKIDYFEYQINQFGKKYPNIRESISYFIGISENAISLLNEILIDENLVLSHRRLQSDATYFDLYNPLNLVLDNRVRDIADYLKNQIFAEKISSTGIINCCLKLGFNEQEWKLFFVRMLFPTFYYDIYENIIKKDATDEDIKQVIYNYLKYELVLKDLYSYLSFNFLMPNMEWLKKT